MSLRCVIGSVGLLALLLILNACSASAPVGPRYGATIEGHVYDSTRNTSLGDSAFAIRRDTRDTMYVDAAGDFSVEGVPPGVYLFNGSAYGFHPHRHLAAVVRPNDTLVTLNIPLLPQLVQADCEGRRVRYHENIQQAYEADSTALRIRILDVFSEGDSLKISSAISSTIGAPVYLPDNFNRRSHLEVVLSDPQGNPIPYHEPGIKNPSLDAKRVYERGDVLVLVPDQVRRLRQRTVVLDESLPPGSSIFAHLDYSFSLSDTLRPTPITDLPSLNLDSLQVPVYDTIRVAEEVLAPDSLVIRRDTSIYDITGVDTVVTRRGYLLYDSERDSNATASARAAADLLYVPDSIKIRARMDSLGGDTTEYVAPPIVDNPEGPPLYIVPRTDTTALDSLLRSDLLARALRYGLPHSSLSAPQITALSEDSLAALLDPPTLPDDRILYTPSDTTLDAGAMPDSLRAPSDTTGAPTATDTTQAAPPETPASDSLRADSVAMDTLGRAAMPSDSLRADSLRAGAPVADSVRVDSMRTDSMRTPFLADLRRGDYLRAPAPGTFWRVPSQLTVDGRQVLIVEPMFSRLRANPAADTTLPDLAAAVPERLGEEETVRTILPQQILIVPTGGYRQKYLSRWTELQQEALEDPYCDILRIPIRSPWGSATIRPPSAGSSSTP